MSTTFHTERLTIAPLQASDATALFEIYRHPDAMRYMPTPPHTQRQQTEDTINRLLRAENPQQWVIRLKNDSRAIGRVNYLFGTRFPGMGYILHPDFWGQGLIVEACRPVLDYGFTTLGYDRVELWIDERNHGSLRVAQKLGFTLKGRIPSKYGHEADYHFMLVWGKLAHEWLAATPSTPTPRFFGVEPVLQVANVAEAAAFYRDQLGFQIDFLYGDPPSHAGVSRGEWTGTVVALQLSQQPLDAPFKPTSHLHIRVDQRIDSLFEQYQANAVEIIAEPKDMPWGFREFTIRDNTGHVLVFATIL